MLRINVAAWAEVGNVKNNSLRLELSLAETFMLIPECEDHCIIYNASRGNISFLQCLLIAILHFANIV